MSVQYRERTSSLKPDVAAGAETTTDATSASSIKRRRMKTAKELLGPVPFPPENHTRRVLSRPSENWSFWAQACELSPDQQPSNNSSFSSAPAAALRPSSSDKLADSTPSVRRSRRSVSPSTPAAIGDDSASVLFFDSTVNFSGTESTATGIFEAPSALVAQHPNFAKDLLTFEFALRRVVRQQHLAYLLGQLVVGLLTVAIVVSLTCNTLWTVSDVAEWVSPGIVAKVQTWLLDRTDESSGSPSPILVRWLHLLAVALVSYPAVLVYATLVVCINIALRKSRLASEEETVRRLNGALETSLRSRYDQFSGKLHSA